MLGASPAWGSDPEHWPHSTHPSQTWGSQSMLTFFFFYTGSSYVAQAVLVLQHPPINSGCLPACAI